MHIPGESETYRAARDELLRAEAALRADAERVASLRRALPAGPPPKADYAFASAETGEETALADLFEPERETLLLYSFMYAPSEGQGACPMCVALLDGLNGAAAHLRRRISIAVAARASGEELRALRDARGWRALRLFTTADGYSRDYGAETPEGGQLPMCHVWTRRSGEVRHFWGAELLHRDDPDWTGHPRHLDPIWALWNVLDLTPEGRGADWWPRLDDAPV